MTDFDEELSKYEKAKEEKIQEFIKRLTTRIPLFIAIAIAIWWLFYGAVKIYPSYLGIVERIGLTIATVVLAMIYCSLIANGGFASARQTKDYKDTEANYEDAIKKGNNKQRQIIKRTKEIAKNNLRECRRNNLEANGLNYTDIFDEEGNLIFKDYKENKYHKQRNPNGFTRNQRKIIKKCIDTKIILPSLFGSISSKYFGLKKEQSLKAYKRKNIISNTALRLLLSIVTVGIVFEFIGISIGSLIYALFQIVLWTGSGYWQRIQNFNFIMEVIVPQYKERTLIIESFLALPIEEQKKYDDKVEETRK